MGRPPQLAFRYLPRGGGGNLGDESCTGKTAILECMETRSIGLSLQSAHHHHQHHHHIIISVRKGNYIVMRVELCFEVSLAHVDTVLTKFKEMYSCAI